MKQPCGNLSLLHITREMKNLLMTFDLNGVDQIIYSFLHLKGNELAIDNEADSLYTSVNLVKQKKKVSRFKSFGFPRGLGRLRKLLRGVQHKVQGRIDFAVSTAKIIETFDADGIDLDWEYPAISGYPGS